MKKIQFPKFTEKMRRRFLAGACGVLMIFISIMAYFTSTEQVTNRFTVGEVKIDLVEPNWVGNADTSLDNNHRTDNNNDISYSDANYILPGELVPKDPKIVNTGKNEAIVFMKVEVPTYTDVLGEEHEVFVVTSDNVTAVQYNASVATTKFSGLAAGDTLGTANWIYLGKSQNTDDDTDHTYIFGYKTILNPEAKDDKINDGVNNVNPETHDNSTSPYQTDNLFKYVMLNPELNNIDSEQGDTFYAANGTPELQNIKIYAYGVQSQFLQNGGTAITPDATGFTQTQLETIWTTAGFGTISNNTIPDADNHNKYDIPADPRDANYPTDGNAWTDGTGTAIRGVQKKISTRKVTYTIDGNDYEITYKKIDGESEWIGWYPVFGSDTVLKAGTDTFSSLQELKDHINNTPGDLTITLDTGTAPTPPTTTDSTPTETKVTVTFKEKETENYKTVGTAEFTKINSEPYILTRGAAELPSAGDGNVWCTEAAYDATKVISSYSDLSLNGTDITLYKVSTT